MTVTKNEIVIAALRTHKSRDDYGHATVKAAFRALSEGFTHAGGTYTIGRGVMVYTINASGGRVARALGSYGDTVQTKGQRPHSQRTQHDMARRQCYAIANQLKKGEIPEPPAPEDFPTPEPQPEPDTPDTPTPDTPDATPEPEVSEPEEVTPEPESPVFPQPTAGFMGPERFLRTWQAMREECERRKEIAEPLDEVSMRGALAASKLYAAGAPWAGEFVLDSYTVAWDQSVRSQFGIKPFGKYMAKVTMPDGFEVPAEMDAHEKIRLVAWLYKCRINTYLKGPKGTGKSHIAKQLAEIIGCEWGFVPLVAGASYTWLTGTYTIDGYVTRPFVELYENGGIFLMDEVDAGDANMVMVANAALANAEFQNPVTGKMLKKHPDFYCIAAGNTWGLGADAQYVGREKQDAAFIDRFATGRVELGYDNALERKLFLDGLGA